MQFSVFLKKFKFKLQGNLIKKATKTVAVPQPPAAPPAPPPPPPAAPPPPEDKNAKKFFAFHDM